MFDFFAESYRRIVYDYADKRATHLPLVGSPLPVFTILGLYLLFVKKYGLIFMKDRPAYDLKNIIQFYNVTQVVISTILFLASAFSFFRLDSWRCLHFNSYGNWESFILLVSWLYYVDKYLDLLDTIFFVLRKKFHLISRLHIYHHVMMIAGSYLFLRYAPVGEVAILGLFNTFVHIFMYYYYYIRISSSCTNDLWWKRYITQLQLAQFTILLVWYTCKLFMSGCSYPKFLLVIALSQTVTMIWMFGNYYYHAFIKSKKPAVKKT